MAQLPSIGDLVLLACSLLLILASIVRFELASADQQARRSSVVLLCVGALGLRLFVARLDPYLNLWDEQFHALVAKNLIEHPLQPTLYDRPLLSFETWDWTHNHVWLHKQPLFLWPIALSLRLLGVSEVAVRLPSVLLSTGVVAIVHRLGTLTLGARAGFYGAMLAATGWFGLDLVTGHATTDHNDVAFVFYVAASLWAWLEMSRSPRRRWAVLVGLFAGLAVLVKWLTGLLVFSGWMLALLVDRRGPRPWIRLVLAFVVACAVFLPWQIYILRAFPEDARREYAHNTLHLQRAVEGHSGGPAFHWHALRDLYGDSLLVPPLVAMSLVVLALRMPRRDQRVALLTCVVATYAFFTAVPTKMTAYGYPVSPVVFLAFGAVLETTLLWLTRRAGVEKASAARWLGIGLLGILALWNVSPRQLGYYHSNRKLHQKPYRAVRIHDTEIIRRLPEILPAHRDWAVFNCREHEGILVMFYTPYVGYDVLPTRQQLATLHARGVAVAVFYSPDLPDYLARDPAVFKIRPSVWDGPLGQVRRVTH